MGEPFHQTVLVDVLDAATAFARVEEWLVLRSLASAYSTGVGIGLRGGILRGGVSGGQAPQQGIGLWVACRGPAAPWFGLQGLERVVLVHVVRWLTWGQCPSGAELAMGGSCESLGYVFVFDRLARKLNPSAR